MPLSALARPAAGWLSQPDGAVILHYRFEADCRLLHIRWEGGATLDEVRRGCLFVNQLIRENHCPAVLSDTTVRISDWSELLPWMEYEALPDAVQGGMRFLANVSSLAPANALSHRRFQEDVSHDNGPLRVGVFIDVGVARRWLLEQLARDDEPLA